VLRSSNSKVLTNPLCGGSIQSTYLQSWSVYTIRSENRSNAFRSHINFIGLNKSDHQITENKYKKLTPLYLHA
jgi:hypothetical protein